MTLSQFLTELQAAQIQLSAQGDRLRCNGPAGALTPELRERIKSRKAEILEFLRTAETVALQPPAIVPLESRGSRTPVFGVAGHNGDVFTYRALAQRLGPDQPFFGLRPPGLDGQTTPLSRVEDLAAYFADQILTFRPTGPVIVAGYCAGGTVAFELAQQLVRRGTPVSSLTLFGCPFPTFYRFMQARLLPGRLVARIKTLVRTTSLAEYRLQFAALGRKAVTVVAPTRETVDEVAECRVKVEQATVAAVRNYVPARFPGRIDVILPNRRWMRSPARPLRWRAMADESTVHAGPDRCAWDTMLQAPSAEDIADLFNNATAAAADRSALRPGA